LVKKDKSASEHNESESADNPVVEQIKKSVKNVGISPLDVVYATRPRKDGTDDESISLNFPVEERPVQVNPGFSVDYITGITLRTAREYGNVKAAYVLTRTLFGDRIEQAKEIQTFFANCLDTKNTELLKRVVSIILENQSIIRDLKSNREEQQNEESEQTLEKVESLKGTVVDAVPSRSTNSAGKLSQPGRQFSSKERRPDHLVEIIRDLTLQVAKSQSNHEATMVLRKTLMAYSNLVDEKRLEVAILACLSANDGAKLTTVIEAVLGKKSPEDFWQRMDSQFYDILRESKKGFKINTVINIILVAIGVALVGNAIAYGWIYKTQDIWNLASGGLGVGALVALFFYRSQNAITRAVGNLSVVDMIFKSHYRAYESITDYDYRSDRLEAHRDIQELESMIKILEKTTRGYVKLMQELKLIDIPTDTNVKTDNSESGTSETNGPSSETANKDKP
jgi:hypothetical protein